MIRISTLAVAVAALAIALAGCGGDDATATQTSPTQTTTSTETETTPTTTEPAPGQATVVRVTVKGGIPDGGIVRESVSKGDRVVIVVRSDVSDEIHVHGYDLMKDVAAGGTARIAFRATIPGRFEIELEDRGEQIADLTVNP